MYGVYDNIGILGKFSQTDAERLIYMNTYIPFGNGMLFKLR